MPHTASTPRASSSQNALRLSRNRMPKLTAVPSSHRHREQHPRGRLLRPAEREEHRAERHRRQQAHEHGVARAAEVGREQRGLQVPRPAEVDDDVAGAHPARELAVAPQVDDVEQALAEPHVRDRRGDVVPARPGRAAPAPPPAPTRAGARTRCWWRAPRARPGGRWSSAGNRPGRAAGTARARRTTLRHPATG